MPRIVLARSLTFAFEVKKGKVIQFRRGEVREVSEGVYHNLMRRGGFADPDHSIDFVRPSQLKAVPRGTTVPVIRDMGLGDVLMVTIPLRDLARRHPGLRFIYATDSRYSALFQELDFIHRTVPIPKIRGTFQWGIDLRGYVERNQLGRKVDRIDLFAGYLLGGKPSTYDYPLQPTRKMREQGRIIAKLDTDDRPAVGLVPRASMKNRSWGDRYNQRFVELALAHGWRVVMLDSPRGNPVYIPEHPRVVDLRGLINVEELSWVISALDVVVSPDTGTTHLAEALKTKCVTYYTTVPPALRVGHYRWTRVLYPEGKLPCLGCIHSPRCRKPDPKPCAELSTPEMVWEQVEFVHANQPPWEVYAWRDLRRGEQPEPQIGTAKPIEFVGVR